MSSPTVKELTEAFPKLDASKAKELSDQLKAALTSEDDDAIDDAMEAANEALGGHGVEAIAGEGGYHVDNYWRDTILLYVNQGDTYDTTICYDTEEGEFFVGSWGDFVEEWEKEGEGEEEEGEEEGDGEEEEEDEEEDEEEEAETENAKEEGE